jgi:chromosome segregation and condensation protein ScpB
MDSSYALPVIIVIVVLILLGKWITEWYHEIKKRNRYMEAQIKLLMEIAAKQGVNQETIAEIRAYANGNTYIKTTSEVKS